MIRQPFEKASLLTVTRPTSAWKNDISSPRNANLTTDIYGLIYRNDELIRAVNEQAELLKEKAEK